LQTPNCQLQIAHLPTSLPRLTKNYYRLSTQLILKLHFIVNFTPCNKLQHL
jgi:hypothetical protein